MNSLISKKFLQISKIFQFNRHFNQHQRKTNRSKYLKAFIYFELASVGAAYLLWNRMNHSIEFRYYLSKNYPFLLNGINNHLFCRYLKNQNCILFFLSYLGYYSIGESIGNLDIRGYDIECWKKQQQEQQKEMSSIKSK